MATNNLTTKSALTGANTAVGDLYYLVDVSDTTDNASGSDKKQTLAEHLQALGVALAASSALTGSAVATDDSLMIYDLSATAIKKMTPGEFLNMVCSATINSTAMTTGFHATQDIFLYSDNGVAKSITVPVLFDALNALNTTALTGANTATDDVVAIYDTSATTTKGITRAELYEAMRLANVAARVIAAGATLSVTAALHGDKIIALDTAAGSVCTLPAATGTGNVYTFITKALATSNSHVVKVANSSDTMAGVISVGDNADGTSTGFSTQATSDTITLNRTTTGSVVIGGDRIVLTDIATNKWSVSGCLVGTGGEATPFSATV